jgi:DNA replication protein DnaC
MNRKELLNSIMADIRRHKDYAERAAAEDMKRAMFDEQFKAGESERRRLILKLASEMNEGNPSATTQLKYDKLIKTLEKRAKELGLSPYAPKYNCVKCLDTGITEDGKLCKCFTDKYYIALKKLSGLNGELRFTLEKHSPAAVKGALQAEKLDKLYKLFHDFADKYPNTAFQNMILSGGIGTGKTCALSALGNALLDKGFEVSFMSAFDMHNAFLSYHIAPAEEKYIYLESLLGAEVLIIDDLGTEPIFKNITLEYLHLVLSERNMSGKSYFISTNLNSDDIMARYGERIFSRLMDKKNSRLINIDGTDLRLLK